MNSLGIYFEVYPSRLVSLFVASSFTFFFMAFSAFAFLLVFAKQCFLALAMAVALALLGEGEVDLGVCWEGKAKEGEGKRVGVSKISTSDVGEAGLD